MAFPDVMQEELECAHEKWKILNPDFEIKYWNGEDCRKYLLENFGGLHLKTFDTIKAYASKCDFFRYCVVFNEGGWYSDWKQDPQVPINSFYDTTKSFVILKDHGTKYTRDNKCIQNCFFGASKGNVVLKNAINLCINHVKTRFYGKRTLDITGPCALRKALRNSSMDYNQIQVGEYVNGWVLFNENKVIQHKCVDCGTGQAWKEGNNYGVLWANGTYYGEKRGFYGELWRKITWRNGYGNVTLEILITVFAVILIIYIFKTHPSKKLV